MPPARKAAEVQARAMPTTGSTGSPKRCELSHRRSTSTIDESVWAMPTSRWARADSPMTSPKSRQSVMAVNNRRQAS